MVDIPVRSPRNNTLPSGTTTITMFYLHRPPHHYRAKLASIGEIHHKRCPPWSLATFPRPLPQCPSYPLLRQNLTRIFRLNCPPNIFLKAQRTHTLLLDLALCEANQTCRWANVSLVCYICSFFFLSSARHRMIAGREWASGSFGRKFGLEPQRL